MFGDFLMEQGMEIELSADIDEVVDLLDKKLPDLRCDDCSYHVSSMKGVLGSKWKLLVRAQPGAASSKSAPMVGHLEIERVSDGLTSFKIPPRQRWIEEETHPSGAQGRLIGTETQERLFTSFVLQLLNLLRERGFIDLPQKLPMV